VHASRPVPFRPLSTNLGFKVGLMGASLHTGNRGVSALGASLATLTWQSRPSATISFLIGNRDTTAGEVKVGGNVRPVDTVNYRLSPKAPIAQQLWWILTVSLLYRMAPSATVRGWISRSNNWVRSVVEADFVGDIRGGDSFADIYGFRGFAMGCLPVLSVIWLRGGIHLLPQTYGPFRSRLAARLARYILLRAQSIWCRDRISLREVERLTGGRRRGSLCPDVAFALEAAPLRVPAFDTPLVGNRPRTLIGLNISGLMYHGGYTRANMFGLRLDYRRFVKRLVEQLLRDPSNQVLLVPHTFAPAGRVESDPDACRDLKATLSPSLHDRVHLVTKEYDQHHIKGIIGMCDFFIGSRMHACIAALSQGIPTVGVAYSRKFAGVFETVGAADWVIDAQTASEDEALSQLKERLDQRNDCRSILRANVAGAQQELSRTFAQILAADGESSSGHEEPPGRPWNGPADETSKIVTTL
jgi:polysaccharide pyruvyl transferase WcaK-like protein